MSLHLAKVNVPLYLRDKRSRKLRRWQQRVQKAERLRNVARAAFEAAFGTQSKIVEMVANGASGEAADYKGRVRFVLPNAFSMIDSPDRTIATLANFAKAMRSARLGSVYIDFAALQQYDLGANGLLDILVDELITEARRTGRTIRWRGNFPADPAHERFVRAMGVIKRLKVEHEAPSHEDKERLVLFENRCKHYIRELRPHQADKKSRVTAEFADHINRCLATTNRELTPLARARMCAYVGEILDNAEQHSQMLDWAIQGYLDTMLDTPMCEVVIFNFGRNIAETFESLPPASFTRLQVQKYIDLHSRRKLFTAGWRKEDLYTLIALQGNVSSKNLTEADTRGNGTVDLIDFFQKVHAECSGQDSHEAKMVIVSGSTCVLFDGKYTMKPNPAGIKVIAFNNDNNLEERPDRDYVRKLDGVMFPGTLIGLRFPLSTARSTVAMTGDST